MDFETIFGQVVSKANNYEVCNGRIYKSNQLRDYENSFIRQCKKYKNRRIDVPFTITLHIFEMSPVYDLDNGIKTILDCLQYVGAIKDDNLCITINASKHIDRHTPRIMFAIEPIQQSLFS